MTLTQVVVAELIREVCRGDNNKYRHLTTIEMMVGEYEKYLKDSEF